jgi:hypothetical protein
MIIARQMLGERWRDYTLSLNASDERGIDAVRQRIKTFARFTDRVEGVPFRLVILDEADEMCLDPDTRILVGDLADLREESLRDLYYEYGTKSFRLPSFGKRGFRLENDLGKIVVSGRADLYRITFEDGRTVMASSNHPFFRIRGREVRTVKTKELTEGNQLADLSDRILRCYGCSRPFYRINRWSGYSHHFCSTSCRNEYLSSFSRNRSEEERSAISLKGAAALKQKGTYQSQEYRRKRSEIASRLVKEGKIPDPRKWKKYGKGEGAFLGKKLSDEHKKAISEGGKKFFSEHPEVKADISRKLRTSLLDPHGSFQNKQDCKCGVAHLLEEEWISE